MRKTVFPIVVAFVLLAGCVTINVYFPAAAAQKAADQIIGNIIGPAPGESAQPAPASSVPPASSSDNPEQGEPLAMRMLDMVIPTANAAQPKSDLDIRTPAIEAIEGRMRQRFRSTMKALLVSGAVGFAHNGDVAIRDAAKIPLAQRSEAKQAVAAENADRAELYKQIAVANGHPEWATRMREEFARRWIAMARSGWYYQDASGNWKQK
ncbi:MAG: YdbL family protein [Rhodanobacteraceae bacterium]